MASIEMAAYEDITREDHTYDEIKKQIKTDSKIVPLWRKWLCFFLVTLTVSLLSVGVVLTVTYFMVRGTMENINVELATDIRNMRNDMDAIEEKLEKMHSDIKCIGLRGLIPKDCSAWCISIRNSGFITVYFDDNRNLSVLCEKGGWTVIQKRFNGAVEFNRNWTDYENGFGDIYGEFWLGFNPDHYPGHSLRIGAATTTGKAHIEDNLVKVLGCWSSDSYCSCKIQVDVTIKLFISSMEGVHYETLLFEIGNKNIAELTSEGGHELRIDVEDWDGHKRYAVYGSFSIGDASTKYRLSISNYSGNAGDGMRYFNGMKFSTYDQDNDRAEINCADFHDFKGGWWYNNCWLYNNARLNGHYTHGNNTVQGKNTSLKKSTMKIRKV